MTDRPPLAPEIERHYAGGQPEDTRLRQGDGRIELARTQEIVRRHLTLAGLTAPCGVLDVGGASGIHATWLAADGHDVHLIDPVPLHVEQARQVAATSDRPFTASVGDARALDAGDDSYDLVLLLGPLYHLVDAGDRAQAWREARRVVRPGGLVVAAAISRFASLHDGISSGMIADPEFKAIVEHDLRTGHHRNPTDNPAWFTTAYFHRPDDLAAEAGAADLDVLAVLGVEGLAPWLLRYRGDDPEDLTDDDIDRYVDAARAVESEPSLLGVSPHLLAVTQRPASTPG